MNTRFWVVVAAIGVLLTLGVMSEAQATPSCNGSTCINACNTFCQSKNKVCDTASIQITCGECGPGICHFTCVGGGSGQNLDCTCGECSGSPIFRKQETKAPKKPEPPKKAVAAEKPAAPEKPATPGQATQAQAPAGDASPSQAKDRNCP